MSCVIVYKNVGTATLNTDLKVSLSADNGSNFTQVTLTATNTSAIATDHITPHLIKLLLLLEHN